jgi:uncharacterized protein
MPRARVHPGIYVEEVPVRASPIAGVATSIAAFVGRAARGPVETDDGAPSIVGGFEEFERRFGGLDLAFPMAYAVRDFFANGGRQALIVRLYKTADGEAGKARIDIANLPLVAASPGAWGNQLRVRIDGDVPAEAAAAAGLAARDLFNLSVRDMARGTEETFAGVSVKESPRRVDRVLAAGSSLLRVHESLRLPASRSPAAHLAAAPGSSAWERDRSSTGVAAEGMASDGTALDEAAYRGDARQCTGLHALRKADIFNLLCVPPDMRGGSTRPAVYREAVGLCVERRALLLVDAPDGWDDVDPILRNSHQLLAWLGIGGSGARNAALYFPRVHARDPMLEGQVDTFVPCGAVAGVMARTDASHAVWRTPAGIEATLEGVLGLDVDLTDAAYGELNSIGINCLRDLPSSGPVVWGARTLRGADAQADEYKYVPVRRLALHIEESLLRGTCWAAFEPNAEPLWARLRADIGEFMHELFRRGAFQGDSARDAWFVKCGADTTTPADIALGIVNIVVGFAPVKPAEFVVLNLRQSAARP